jgi:hypothetical protein
MLGRIVLLVAIVEALLLLLPIELAGVRLWLFGG